jgi:O-antigen/teichoic acid export membrane protein
MRLKPLHQRAFDWPFIGRLPPQAIVMSCVAVLAVPAALGLDRLLVREIAVLQTHGDWAHAKGLLRRSQQLVLGVSIAIAGVAALAFSLFYRVADGRLLESFQIGMVLVPLIAFARLRQAALQGFGRVVAGQVPEGVVQPAIMMLLAAAVACRFRGPCCSAN